MRIENIFLPPCFKNTHFQRIFGAALSPDRYIKIDTNFLKNFSRTKYNFRPILYNNLVKYTNKNEFLISLFYTKQITKGNKI